MAKKKIKRLIKNKSKVQKIFVYTFMIGKQKINPKYYTINSL